jgi:hypothetical protein
MDLLPFDVGCKPKMLDTSTEIPENTARTTKITSQVVQ